MKYTLKFSKKYFTKQCVTSKKGVIAQLTTHASTLVAGYIKEYTRIKIDAI